MTDHHHLPPWLIFVAEVSTGIGVGYKRFVSAGSNQRFSYGAVYDGTGQIVAPPANSTAGQMGQTPTSAKEVPVRINVFRNATAATTSGWIGITNRHRWATVGGRANGQTLQDGSSYWAFAAGVWVPWDSSTPSLS